MQRSTPADLVAVQPPASIGLRLSGNGVTTLIRNAPLLEYPYRPEVAGFPDSYRIPEKKPFAWMALGLPDDAMPSAGVCCFPVVIDTGSNQYLSIREEMLHAVLHAFRSNQRSELDDWWLEQFELQKTKGLKPSNRGPFYNLDLYVFLFRTLVTRGKTVRLQPDRTTFRKLEFADGIQVFPAQGDPSAANATEPLDRRPGTPVLGMGAIIENRLRFRTDGKTYALGIPPPWWRRLFG